MKPDFTKMTVTDALNYCGRHRKEWIKDSAEDPVEAVEQYECLILILRDGDIKPTELPDYGMDYDD